MGKVRCQIGFQRYPSSEMKPVGDNKKTRKEAINASPSISSPAGASLLPQNQMNGRKASLIPAVPALKSGDDSVPYWRRLLKFINSLKEQVEAVDGNIVDIISGEQGESVLRRLYAYDDQFVLRMLQVRLNALNKIYSDPELLDFFSGDDNEQEQEIACMIATLQKLKTKKDEKVFCQLLRKLGNFEKDQNRVPFESRCNLAFLKIAGVDINSHPDSKVIPAYMAKSVYYMLKPEDVSETTGWFCWRDNAYYIDDAVHDLCVSEGKKKQQHMLQQQIDMLCRHGNLDLEHFTVAENIRNLCENNPDHLWLMIDAFYKEEVRNDATVQNKLETCGKDHSKTTFLLALIEEDKTLSAWIKGPLSQQLLHHYECKLLDELKGKGELDKAGAHRLASFTRQAESAQYQVNGTISDLLETFQLREMLHYIQEGGKAGYPLWLAGSDITSVQAIKEHLTTYKPDGISHCIRALHRYLFSAQGVKSVAECQQMLRLRNDLLKVQIEYLFAQARKQVDQTVVSPEEKTLVACAFNDNLKKIAQLEEMRPQESFLGNNIRFSSVVGAIGCYLLRGNEASVGQRLRDISLEFQLKQYFDYQFTAEINARISRVPGQFCTVASNVASQVKKAANLIYSTVSGNVSVSEACKESMKLQRGTSNSVLDIVRQEMEGYAELCKQNSHMARVLAGNIAQTLAVLENTIGTGSELYNIFNQLKSRVGMEAMASYMTDQFSPAEMDVSSLEPEKVMALKRMFALCQLFQWAPEAVVGITGAAHVTKNAASGSLLGTAWSATKLAFRMATTHMVKQGISSLPDEDVRGINTAIMNWQHGPKEAAQRIQAMQRAAEFMADQAKGHSLTYSATKALFRPLTTRFSRTKNAFKAWMSGTDSGWRVVAEALKVALVVTPVVGATVAAPVLAFLLGPALIGYVIAAGFALSLMFISLFYHTDPGEDFVALVTSKVSALLEPGLEEMVKNAKKEARLRFQAGGYDQVILRLAYVQLYDQFWPGFKEKYKAVALGLEKSFEADRATDTDYQEQLQKLKAMLNELKALETVMSGDIERKNIIKCVPASLCKDIPEDNTRAAYWATARVQMIREILFQKLGTNIVPEDEEALERKLYCFEQRLAAVAVMKQMNPDMESSLKLAQQTVGPRVSQIVESFQERACLLTSQIVMRQTIMNMAGDEKLSKDRLDRLTCSKRGFNRRIEHELEVMRQVYATQGVG